MILRTQLRPAIVALLLFTLLTGVFYPLSITGLAQLFFHRQANGSLITQAGQMVGSELVGQEFAGPEYFWSRPSATAGHPYNAFDAVELTGSSGSNLGPLSSTLVEAVRLRVDALIAADPESKSPIPADLVTASASGLDADISPAAAYYQIARVAQARAWTIRSSAIWSTSTLRTATSGFWASSVVNVLLLNLALDEINKSSWNIAPIPISSLAEVQAEEPSRGRLKIYLGYAAGVGITFAMLGSCPPAQKARCGCRSRYC